MRSFLVALALLAAILGFSTAQSIYVGNVTDRLLEGLDSGDLSALAEDWDGSRPYLSLTVNGDVLRQISCYLDDLTLYSAVDDPGAKADADTARQRLIEAIDTLRKAECLQVLSVL